MSLPQAGSGPGMPPALTGHCLCGAVQFEVDQPLLRAAYCHCTRCQRRTGVGAGCSGYAVPGSVHVVAGEALITGYDPGDGWIKEFCSVCGGHLFARDPDDPARRSVRMGAIDGDPGVRPSRRQFTAYAAVWEPIPDDDALEDFPENANA